MKPAPVSAHIVFHPVTTRAMAGRASVARDFLDQVEAGAVGQTEIAQEDIELFLGKRVGRRRDVEAVVRLMNRRVRSRSSTCRVGW